MEKKKPKDFHFTEKYISDERSILLSHYSDQQHSQATRLIGFVAGLFALWTLTAVVLRLRLSSIFPSFPTIPMITEWVLSPDLWIVDLSKVIFLYLGTAFILCFILRSIFRFVIFAHFTTFNRNKLCGYRKILGKRTPFLQRG